MAEITNNPYVKFLRGTPAAYASLTPKDPDTLYFITVSGASVGKLYLGDILVAGNVTEDGTNIVDSLAELIDVNLKGLASGMVLGYNGTEWIPMTLPEAITTVMIGATETEAGVAGLVPAPAAGDHNKFLRGDGKWVEIATGDIDLSSYAKIEVTNALNTRVTTLESNQENIENTLTWGIL